MNELPVKRLNTEAKMPTRAHPGDAGLDFYCLEDVALTPHEPARAKTGIAMAIPFGFVGLICDRSSMGAKGIRVLGGVVDAGYRGEVQVLLINLTNQTHRLAKGDKVAQMLILPVSGIMPRETEQLDDTSRADGGFGSTGR